jgi:hypothetical protein
LEFRRERGIAFEPQVSFLLPTAGSEGGIGGRWRCWIAGSGLLPNRSDVTCRNANPARGRIHTGLERSDVYLFGEMTTVCTHLTESPPCEEGELIPFGEIIDTHGEPIAHQIWFLTGRRRGLSNEPYVICEEYVWASFVLLGQGRAN